MGRYTQAQLHAAFTAVQNCRSKEEDMSFTDDFAVTLEDALMDNPRPGREAGRDRAGLPGARPARVRVPDEPPDVRPEGHPRRARRGGLPPGAGVIQSRRSRIESGGSP